MIKTNLKDILYDQKMTQKELALKSGVMEYQISKIANNQMKDIMVGSLKKICKALGCSMDDLLVNEEEQ